MTARDRHMASKLTLEILIAQLLRKVGGTGCELSDEQYIAQQIKEWSNSRERLLFAIACFTDLKETCLPPRKEQHGTMERKTTQEHTMVKAQQEAPRSTDGRPGFLVCGVFPNGNTP